MTRKVIAAAIGLLVGMTLLASPAQAAHFGTTCAVSSSIGQRIARMCIIINRKSDLNINNQTEALSSVQDRNQDNYWESIQWQWDWIHLYRNGNLVRSEGPTGWLSGYNDSYSTNWYTCSNSTAATYRAVARWRFRAWDNTGHDGPFYSTWTTLSTDTLSFNDC